MDCASAWVCARTGAGMEIIACGGGGTVLSFFTMNRRAFSLIELLIVVAIIAVLVGVAMPYYQDYMRQTRLTKAKHELDIIKQALIKHDTFEDKPFRSTNLRLLLGRYLQDLPRDPWGRDYEIDYLKGEVMSMGPDTVEEIDDIIVDYKPPLALQKATWIDRDNNRMISDGDLLRLEFSRFLKPDQGDLRYTNASPPAAASELWFSPCFVVSTLIATETVGTTTEILIEFNNTASNTAFAPGSSTVRVSPFNEFIMDYADRKAIGVDEYEEGLEVIIKAN